MPTCIFQEVNIDVIQLAGWKACDITSNLFPIINSILVLTIYNTTTLSEIATYICKEKVRLFAAFIITFARCVIVHASFKCFCLCFNKMTPIASCVLQEMEQTLKNPKLE